MLRIVMLALSLAALPAFAIDLEKWADELVNRQMEAWKKERLETAVKGRDPKARLEAVESLSANDADSLPAFAIALGDSDARVRRAAASQMWSAEKRAEPYRPQLTKALDDADANVVAYAAGALQATGVNESELVAPRKGVLESAEASTTSRYYAARNLVGYEAPTKLVGPMIVYVEDNTRPTRDARAESARRNNIEAAEKTLERLIRVGKDRDIIKPLTTALAETKTAHVPLMRTLGKFDPKPAGWTEMVLQQLGNPNPRARYEALSQLRTVKDEREVAVWVPRAAAMLRDPDDSVRSEATWALGSARGLAASEIEKVASVAKSDSSPTVRRNGMRALGEIAEADQAVPAATRAKLVAVARPVLEAAKDDADKDTREAAVDALRNVIGRGGEKAAPVPVAAAAPSAPNEASGMAALRALKVAFEPNQFFRALSEVDVKLVRAFLDAGMSPSASLNDMGPPMRVMLFSSQGCSPSERPTRAETKAMVKLLLERGADINGADANGNSALTEAASKGCDRETIRMLLKAGANPNAKHASGLHPFEMGLWSGHDGLEEFLAAGYRLPPDKAKAYLEAYKDRPAAVAMVKKAVGKK